MAALTLTASGALKDTPISELIVYFAERVLSGTLVLETAEGEKHALTFQEGKLQRIQVNRSETRLGAVLMSLDAISKEECQQAERHLSEGLFGKRLVAAGLAEAQLQWGLHQQFQRQMALLANLDGSTGFGYYQSVDLLEGWGGEGMEVDPLAAVWAAVREVSSSSRVLQAYASMSAIRLRLHRSSRISRFGFQAKERAVLDVLRVQPQYLRELRATGLASDKLLQNLVYALVITGHLDVGKKPLGVKNPQPCYVAKSAQHDENRDAHSQEPSVIAVEPASKASSRLLKSRPESKPQIKAISAKDEKRDSVATAQFLTRNEIVARAAELDELTAYQLLEVSTDCSAAEIASSFSRLAKRWHPDRLSPPCADLKESVTRVFAQITQARSMLSHPDRRREYDEEVDDPASNDEKKQVERILQAAADFQKAEIMVRKKDMRRAEQLACKASEIDSDQPEYSALHAWILTKRSDCSPGDLKKSVAVLQNCALRQKENVRIRYYLGTALKRMGDNSGALREFRFVAGRDPSNLDAVRELRLHSMRSPVEAAGPSGFLGRLFKR